MRKMKRKPRTINDQKVTYATDVERSLVQDEEELVLVGADVVGLYPSLVDIEVANICYDAVMASKIKFSNIDYRKARLYIASNLNKTDQRLSPLWRVLPRRKKSVGGVRPGVTASPECEENWIFPNVQLTDLEMRMIMATVIKIGVIVMMNTHVYEFDGCVYLQRAGGPIGLRSTCAVARVVMNAWDAKWMEMVSANNIRVLKNNRYMDDIRSFLKALREGWRWYDGHLCHTNEWEAEDIKSETSPTARTARVLVGMMNDIYSFLNFTTELGEHFPDKKLPSLDTNVWVANKLTILFEYFGKPMATNLMVQADSALSKSTKLSSLAEEIGRRLRNTSQEIDNTRKIEILEEACVKMKTSGHHDDFMKEAVAKGIRNFQEKVRRSNLDPSDRQYQPLYQGIGWQKDGRSRTKALKRKNWFMDKDEDRLSGRKDQQKKRRKGLQKAGKVATQTVVFVPNTRAGVLLRKMNESEEKMSNVTGFRIRFQEAGGSQLKNSFSTDLGKGKHCGRSPCPPCDSSDESKRGNCKARNLVYESKCMVCNTETKRMENVPEGRTGIYIGETSRSLHERAIEHINDAKSFDPKSHIVKHWANDHPDRLEMPPFAISTTCQYKDCLSRQIGEALKIHYSQDTLLNSKSEYIQNCLTRITIEESSWERSERGRLEDLEEMKEKEAVTRFRERVEMGKTVQDIIDRIIDDVPLKPQDEATQFSSLEEPARKLQRLEDDEHPLPEVEVPGEGTILEEDSTDE